MDDHSSPASKVIVPLSVALALWLGATVTESIRSIDRLTVEINHIKETIMKMERRLGD